MGPVTTNRIGSLGCFDENHPIGRSNAKKN